MEKFEEMSTQTVGHKMIDMEDYDFMESSEQSIYDEIAKISNNAGIGYEQIITIFNNECNSEKQKNFSLKDLREAKRIILEERNKIKKQQNILKQKLICTMDCLKKQLQELEKEQFKLFDNIKKINFEMKRIICCSAILSRNKNSLQVSLLQKQQELKSIKCFFSKTKKIAIELELLNLKSLLNTADKELFYYNLLNTLQINVMQNSIKNFIKELNENDILIKHASKKVNETEKKILQFNEIKEDQTERDENNKKILVINNCIKVIEQYKETLKNNHVADLEKKRKEECVQQQYNQ